MARPDESEMPMEPAMVDEVEGTGSSSAWPDRPSWGAAATTIGLILAFVLAVWLWSWFDRPG